MKDKLQRFVRDNREAFETQEPSDDLWNRIHAQLDQQAPVAQDEPKIVALNDEISDKPVVQQTAPLSIWRGAGGEALWRVAASVVLVVGLGWGVYRLNEQYGLSEAPEVALTSTEYAKQVGQYTQLIDTKREELVKLTKNNPELAQEFAVELGQLESSYQNLKADLPKNPNQETVIQAMIQNLQWQIDLLNQQLNIIQRIKNKT
ncbi:MAG: hypothetical protein MUE30_10700, partial [Spirosomaceae bacterium]|nr:hypothetical protein [Spirosomataceae bacterium]